MKNKVYTTALTLWFEKNCFSILLGFILNREQKHQNERSSKKNVKILTKKKFLSKSDCYDGFVIIGVRELISSVLF